MKKLDIMVEKDTYTYTKTRNYKTKQPDKKIKIVYGVTELDIKIHLTTIDRSLLEVKKTGVLPHPWEIVEGDDRLKILVVFLEVFFNIPKLTVT